LRLRELGDLKTISLWQRLSLRPLKAGPSELKTRVARAVSLRIPLIRERGISQDAMTIVNAMKEGHPKLTISLSAEDYKRLSTLAYAPTSAFRISPTNWSRSIPGQAIDPADRAGARAHRNGEHPPYTVYEQRAGVPR